MFSKPLAGYLFAAGFCLAGLSSAAAQSASAPRELPELVTDRPDFTESSEVVGTGVLQVESGINFEQDRVDGIRSRSLSTPQLLVRVGLTPRFELRLGGDGFVSESVSTTAGSARTNGHTDAEVGFKYTLIDAADAGVAVAVIPSVSLPTGRTGVTSGGYDPGVKLTWARELPRGFGLSGNFNMASITVDDLEREWEPSVSLSVGRGLSANWGAYWETYGFFTDGDCACTFNTGVTRALGGNMQFDVEVGRGLTASASDWFAGVGFAVRRVVR